MEPKTIEEKGLEYRIRKALKEKPMCSEDLLFELGIEPGGGELVFPLRRLTEQGIISRRKTYIYELRRNGGS